MANKELPQYPGIRPHGSGIQIDFRHKGQRFRPTLKIAPTKANIKLANSIREAIRLDIVKGNLDITKYFDDTKITEHFIQKYRSKLTVSQLIDEWIERDRKRSGRASNNYMTVIRNHIKPILGKYRINELQVSQIRKMQDSLAKEQSSKSINNIMIPLRQAFKMAFEEELIDSNPMDRIANLKVVKVKPEPLSISEVDSVLSILQRNEDHHNFYRFAIWTGLSTGEQLGLKWSDVDLGLKEIHIQRMWVKGEIRPVKAKGRERRLELIQPAIDALQAQKALGYNSKWVFVDPEQVAEEKRPWRLDRITNPWNEALASAGIPHRKKYTTRHTYASIMLSAGMSLEWLKERMGHSNFRMLEEVYASWVRVSASERQRVREWISGRSQNGHTPEMEKEFFEL